MHGDLCKHLGIDSSTIVVTLFSTMMSSSSSIMVHMTLHAFSSYGPSFMKIHHLKRCPLSKLNSFDQNFMKLCHTV